MEDKKNKFLKNRDLVIDNIQTLRLNVQDVEDLGFQDPDETLYNELTLMIDDAKAADSETALSEVITRAKTIESKLDNFFAHQGMETMELSWPRF